LKEVNPKRRAAVADPSATFHCPEVIAAKRSLALLSPAGQAGEGAASVQAEEDEPHDPHRRPSRISLARLLKRVFEINLEHCPNCCGELETIAATDVQYGNDVGVN
jgi:hypothetical protein